MESRRSALDRVVPEHNFIEVTVGQAIEFGIPALRETHSG
jgi:hypothetical protein